MNKIYQKTLSELKTSANPQLGAPMQAVIAGVDRQSRNEKDLYERTGSRVHARDDRQRRKGFTLIELLVVVLIIGILAAIALPQYQTAVLKAKYTQLETAVRALKNAEELHYLSNGAYLSELDQLPDSGLVFSSGIYYRHPKGYVCHLDGNVGINCSLSNGFSYYMGFDMGFLRGRQLCFAFKTNKEQNKVCLSKGGTPDGGWSDVNRYLLP